MRERERKKETDRGEEGREGEVKEASRGMGREVVERRHKEKEAIMEKRSSFRGIFFSKFQPKEAVHMGSPFSPPEA